MKPNKVKKILVIGAMITVVMFIITAILVLVYVLTPKEVSKPDDVCSRLERNIGSQVEVYPAILGQKSNLEASWKFRVTQLYGDQIKPWRWDDRGVSCSLPVELCELGFTYCFNVNMLVPVNYTLWEVWIAEDELDVMKKWLDW